MGKFLRNVVKGGAIFCVVGALLGVAAPLLATALGPALIGEGVFAAAMGTSALWTSAFFGAFGAIDAAVRPAVSALFGDKEAGQALAKPTVRPHNVTINNHSHDVDINQDINVNVDQSRTKNSFVANLEDSRAKQSVLLAGNQRVH